MTGKLPPELKQLSVLIATCCIDMIGFAMVLPLLPYYAKHLNATPIMIGFLTAAFSVAQLIAAPYWGRFSDRVGRRPALLIGLFASAIAYIHAVEKYRVAGGNLPQVQAPAAARRLRQRKAHAIPPMAMLPRARASPLIGQRLRLPAGGRRHAGIAFDKLGLLQTLKILRMGPGQEAQPRQRNPYPRGQTQPVAGFHVWINPRWRAARSACSRECT